VLFRRAAKGPLLTPSGEAFLAYAKRILGLTSELVTELAKVSKDVSATLVVAANESLSAYVLPSRLATLRERWPKVRMEVVTGVCADIRESVDAGRADLGLVLEGEQGASDDAILAKARLVILAAPGHRLVSARASPDQVRRCDFYMSDASGNYHQLLRRYFEVAQVPQPRTQALGTVEGVKRGILGGDALGLLPAHAVEQELREGALAEIKVTPTLPGLVLRSVVRPGSGSSPVVDDLLRSLRGPPLGEIASS
jgi:DNA-binding transcriptional LysR family regulator